MMLCTITFLNIYLPNTQCLLALQLVNFAVRHRMDYVAASFVQSGDDVR